MDLEGRDLHLAVPRAAVDVLRARAAFLDATVHVHPTRRTGFGDPEPPMTRTEATGFYRRLGDVTPSPRWDATGWHTVDLAIERLRTGADAGQRECLLQAAIGTDPSLLGLTRLHREVPVWRPGQQPRCQRGFVDFLGRDVTRTGHVIEMKRGPDPQLGIQALDYWAWTDAHRDGLAALLDADADRPFELDLVLGSTERPLLHPAAAATLPRLTPDIVWRCHLVTDGDTIAHPGQLLSPTTEPLRPRHLPD